MAFLEGDDTENTLTGTNSNDFLIGNDGDDTLIGLEGSDQLRGGAGADYMVGGIGHDSYWIDNLNDIVVEDVNEGADTIFTSLNTYRLGLNFENLLYIGTSRFKGVGNDQDNQIFGGKGKDTLIGNGGTDILLGGQGNDVYVVDFRDDIRESVGNGIDTLLLTHGYFYNYHLSDNVENVTNKSVAFARIFGNELDNKIIGNSKNDDLRGNGGDDILFGKGGKDNLSGGDGNDALKGGRGADRIDGGLGADLIHGGAGKDIVFYEWSNEGVQINLKSNQNSGGFAEGDKLIAIEDIFGSDYGDTIVGSNKNNEIWGAGGNDLLKGAGGDDTLYGGGGNDILVGGDGADKFVFSGSNTDVSHLSHLGIGVDTIRDFEDGDSIDMRFIDASMWGRLGDYQSFSWIGSNSFSGDGAELRYFYKNGNTVITGDIENLTNGSGEFRIKLLGIHDLSENDFLL